MFTVHRYQPAAEDGDGPVHRTGTEAKSQPQQDVPAETITVLSRRKAVRLKRRQEAAAVSQSDDAEDAAEQRRQRKEIKRQKRAGRRQQPTVEEKETADLQSGDAARPVTAVDLRALRSVKNSTRPLQQRETTATAASAASALSSAVKKGQQRKDPLVRAAERAARKRAREMKERRENGEELPADEEEKLMQEAADAAAAAAVPQQADELKDGALAGRRKKVRTEQQQQHSASSASSPAAAADEEQKVREQRRLAARPPWMSAAHRVDPKASCPTSALPLHPHLLQRLQHHGITELFPVQAAVIPVILSHSDRDVCVSSPTGSGKCFAAGTRLRLYSGDTIAVQDIRGGEQLMGDDGTARVVTTGSVSRGRAALFRIQPHWEGAAAFTVNSEHVLVLVNCEQPAMRRMEDRQAWTVSSWQVDSDNAMRCMRRCFGSETAAAQRLQELTDCFAPLEWEVSVDAFRAAPEAVRRVCRLFQCGPVTFHSPLPRLRDRLSRVLGAQAAEAQLDWAAWYIGMWIVSGDGCSDAVRWPQRACASFAAITRRMTDYHSLFGESSPSVVSTLSESGEAKGSRDSIAWRLLCSYALTTERRHIPQALICDSLRVRRQLLAGLLEGSGGGAGDGCDILTADLRMAEACKALAASLGIRNGRINPSLTEELQSRYSLRLILTHSTLRCCDSSPCHPVSAVVDRSYGFDIIAQPEAEYHGFAVSGSNRRFLLEDFTVTHNTLIYILPILHVLSSRRVLRLRCLVLVPSRDLCRQVGREMEEYASGLGLKVGISVGGGSFQREQETLVRRRQVRWSEMVDYSSELHAVASRRGRQGEDAAADEAEYESAVDVLVTTPGRLMDHLDSTPGFSLRHLRFLVVDEVDRLVTQRYSDWTRRVWEEMRRPPPPATAAAPLSLQSEAADCQKLLFSATLSGNPAQLASLRLHRPVLFVDSQSRQKRFSIPAGLSASFFLCDANEKPLLLLHTLSTLQLSGKEEGKRETAAADGKQRRPSGDQVLVFTSSLDTCHRVARLLSLWGGWSSAEYSSALTQHQRDRLLSAFRARRLSVLVCSDVMSRGLDISGVSVVVNYDPPVYLQTYLHRIGRTARAGAAGRAVTLLKRSEYGFFVAMLKRAANSFMSRQRQDRQSMQQMKPRYSRAITSLRDLITRERRGRLSKTDPVQPVGDEEEEQASNQAADAEAEEGEEEQAGEKEEGVDEAEWSL